jgi:tape measure domain-containing protein
MANALGDMVVRIVGDNSELDSALTKSERQLKTFSDSMTKVGKSLSLFVTAPLLAAGVAAVKSAGQFQLFQASFETMLGDAAKAKKLIRDLEVLAAKTPFKMDDLAKGAQVLLQYGITTEKLLPTIRQLGDVAQGDSEKFNRLVLAFGQTQSTGRLMGQDLLQMINSGFNPLKVIADKTGQSIMDLKKAMEKGAISADMVAEAFAMATSEGGMFFNGMEKASQTLPGLMSTLSDDIGALGRSFAQLFMPAIMDTVKRLSELTQSFTTLPDSTKKAVVAFAGVLAVAGPLLIVIPKIITAIRTMSTAFATSTGPIGLVVAGVGLLVAGIVKIIAASKEFAEKEKLMDDAIKGNLKSTEEYNAALDVMKSKTDELQKQKETLQKQIKGEIDITDSLADTTAILMGEQTAAGAAGIAEKKRELEAIDAQIKKEKEQTAAAEKNRAKLEAAEKKAAADAAKKAADDARRAADEAAAAAEAAAKLKEKEDGIKAIRAALEEAALTEAQVIEKEIAKYKEWGLTDAEVMAYIRQTHAQFYEEEKEAADERIDYTERVNQILADDQQHKLDRIEELRAAEKKAQEEKEKADNEAAAKEEAELYERLTRYASWAQSVVNIMSEMFAAIDANRKRDLAKEIDVIDEATTARLAALDTELQAKLYAAGLSEAATEEQYKKEIAKALAAGDAERAAELQKALDKLLITEDYEAQKAAVEEAAAKKKAQLEYNAALASWKMQLALGVANAAQAVLSGLLTKPFIPAGIAAGILAGVMGAVQVAAITQAKPQPPALAEGGIAMPRPGGQMVNVAEAGQAEAIIPLTDRMLARMGVGAGGSEEGDIHLVVNMDSKPILDKIFPATRNRTVLIDARAVVAA